MRALSFLTPFATRWYISAALLGAIGIVLGSMVFFFVWPGKPKVGIIDIPFTVINGESAFEITALLDYARDRDSIKSVVIHLDSPGGSAAPSEKLYLEIAKLSEKKPVVVVINQVAASGGYMMVLGANYVYAKPSSIVAGIGVIISSLPGLLPGQPSERQATSGPFKGGGGDYRHYISLLDQLKQSFAQLVVAERGDLLRISLEEVMEGKIYSGVESVQLGLVDAIGGGSDAVEKAASLANISGYDIVDVNTEVSLLLNRKLERISEPLRGTGLLPSQTERASVDNDQLTPTGPGEWEGLTDEGDLGVLRRLPLPGGIGEDPETALPDFPFDINKPNVYYLYVGPSP